MSDCDSFVCPLYNSTSSLVVWFFVFCFSELLVSFSLHLSANDLQWFAQTEGLQKAYQLKNSAITFQENITHIEYPIEFFPSPYVVLHSTGLDPNEKVDISRSLLFSVIA